MQTREGPVAAIEWLTTSTGVRYGYVYYHRTVRKRYTAALGTIRCIDDGFWRPYKLELRDFLKYLLGRLGTDNLDPFVFAGGGLVISSPEMPSDRDFVLRNIGISRRHHGTKLLKIYNHHDCAFAGGFTRFNNDLKTEFEFHCQELFRAAHIVREAFPDLEIRLHFIDCEGVIRIEEPK